MRKTTIRISEETKKILDELKMHPRETYDDVLRRLLQKKEVGEEESPQGKEGSETNDKKVKKTAIDIIKERGFLVESKMNLRNADAFFGKLEREGVKIIETGNDGRVAIDNKFYEKFWEELSKIEYADEKKVLEILNKADKRFTEIFKILRSNAVIYFDANEKKWKEVI
jgi:predicted CopG family antitoxin